MILIRSALFNVLFYLAFFVVAIAGLPCLLVSRGAAMAVVRLWARVSVELLALICGLHIEFRNTGLLPKGASIVAAKHQSFLETFAMILVLDDFAYILKKELLSLPFFGWYARATGMIGVDRGRGAAAIPLMQKAVRDRLAAGRQVLIFPEGTRRPVGAAPFYKGGVAAICMTAGAPCTPVALNTGLFWPRHSFRRRPGRAVIEFLPSIPPGLGKADFMQALKGAIEPATDALVAEALLGDPTLARAAPQDRPAAA